MEDGVPGNTGVGVSVPCDMVVDVPCGRGEIAGEFTHAVNNVRISSVSNNAFHTCKNLFRLFGTEIESYLTLFSPCSSAGTSIASRGEIHRISFPKTRACCPRSECCYFFVYISASIAFAHCWRYAPNPVIVG